MVYEIGTIEVSEGKVQEAKDLMKKMISYVKASGNNSQVVQSVTGPRGTWVIIGMFESMDAWAKQREKDRASSEFQALLREGQEKQCFVPRSHTPNLYETIE